MQQTAPGPASQAVDIDMWEFFDTTYAREVPCNSLSNFYLFLMSEKTHAVGCSSLDTTKGTAAMALYGPLCDDANMEDKHNTGRLVVNYKILKDVLQDPIIGLTDEQKEELVKTVRDKGSFGMDMFCRALGLKRVR